MLEEVKEINTGYWSGVDPEETTFGEVSSIKEIAQKNRTKLIIRNYFLAWHLNTEMSSKPSEKISSEFPSIPNDKTLKAAELVDRIHKLFKNPDNWDGYGTPKISNKLRNKFYEILELICTNKLELPFIVPVCGGGLQFEWKRGKRELELEFNEESISVLKTEEISADEISYREKDNVSKDEIPAFIRWVENTGIDKATFI